MTFRIGMYGQSNMLNMSGTTSSPPSALTGTSYFDGANVVVVPNGNGVRELLNGVKTLTGLDCLALNGAVAGVPISSLQKGQTAYTNFLAQIQNVAVGGVLDCIVFDQGENDQVLNTTTAEWLNALGQLHSDLCADMGVTTAQCPLFLSTLATSSANPLLDQSFRQQHAILVAAANLADTYFSHSNMDAVLVDGLHWNGASYGRAGQRFARAIAYKFGYATGPVSPSIVSASVVSPTQTDVTISHGIGTDFTPTSAISGFEVNSGGVWIAATGARLSATVVRLTHASATLSRSVRYQYSASANVSAPILDNSSIAVPLPPTALPVQVDARPSPLFIGRAVGTSGSSTSTGTLVTEKASTNRRIFAFVGCVCSQTLLSASIGGVAATVHHASLANTISVALISAVVPSGKSLAISLTFTGGIFNSPNVFAWEVDDTKLSSATPTDIQIGTTSAATAKSVNLTNNAGGFSLALACFGATDISGKVSSDVNLARNIGVLGNGLTFVAVDGEGLGTYTSRQIQANFASSGSISLLAASWAAAASVQQLQGRLR